MNTGLPNVSPAQFGRARGSVPISAVRNLYNLVNRWSVELLRRTAELGIGFVPYFPLGSALTDSRPGPTAR